MKASPKTAEASTHLLLLDTPCHRAEGRPAVRLVLRLALTQEERSWARSVCREQHYLHQEVHSRARPVFYLVVREEGDLLSDGAFRARHSSFVGLLVYSRMQSSRCRGWYGSEADVRRGWATYTQWEILALSRFWLDARLQKGGAWYIPRFASLAIKHSLKVIGYHYLLLRPPAFLDRPFEVKQVISYCDSHHYDCQLYRFSRFHLARENDAGLRTYVHQLSPLTSEQRKQIVEASRLDKAAQKKRSVVAFQPVQEVLLLLPRIQQQAA
jgi:hypothetical protein